MHYICFQSVCCAALICGSISSGHAQRSDLFSTKPVEKKSPVTSKLDEVERKAEGLGAYSVSSLSHSLSTGDIVEIKVYQEDELTTKARIDSDGKIAMPLLGAIRVGGQSVEQAQTLIRDLLSRDYLHTPQVSLTVVEFAKKRFSVLGEVNNPGFYMMPEGESMTVLQAIAMAGGFTPFARSGKVAIKRKISGGDKIIQVDGKAMARNARTPGLEIQSGDTIYVNLSIF